MLRYVRWSFLLACALAMVFAPPAVAESLRSPHTQPFLLQTDGVLAAAGDAVREFSELEAARDFGALYTRLHPDARAVVPRSAVVGWYEAFFADREAHEATVTEVRAEPWTWGVTGVTYDDAVTVLYTQPYTIGGQSTEVSGEVHVVPDEGGWGWFFGASPEFVEAQVAAYGDDGSATAFALGVHSAATLSPEERFPDPLVFHVNSFWEKRFADAQRLYIPPADVVAFDTPMSTPCGPANPEEEAAFYCVIDQKIYYSVPFRQLIEQQIGDFAWIVVIAHEWGHHIQAQLGFELGLSPDRGGEIPPIVYEQQADCLAGAYSVDAELVGWLDPGDVDEALRMTELSGDPPGTAWNDPRAHGSGEERIDAFLQGYSGGIGVCGLDLGLATPVSG
ncbi:MAG: neutral zinc metallopeptidase [Thermomicrobiales bacterium]|nr:neutral zinc metallopeptidase [Thermomicrobiales bacterium]